MPPVGGNSAINLSVNGVWGRGCGECVWVVCVGGMCGWYVSVVL